MPINPEIYGAVVFFYDAQGANWRVRPTGDVDEIPKGQGYPRSW